MVCERCHVEHDGSYGSGRFCGVKCARGFSSMGARDHINRLVSWRAKQANWKPPPVKITPEMIAKRVGSFLDFHARKPWERMGARYRRRIVLKEQGGRCLECGITEWNGKPITLEIDHINGDHRDNRRENLRGLCPNCHSQTPTFRYTAFAIEVRRRAQAGMRMESDHAGNVARP